MDLNKAMIIGRLTRDPELRNTSGGQSVTSFSLATNRYWTGTDGQKQEKVEFHNIVLWSRLAEIAVQYLKKGRRIFIEGRLQTREWAGQDGVKRRTTEVVGESMIMLDGPRGESGAPTAAPMPVINQDLPVEQSASQPQEVIEEEVKVEDIPF